jgi:hypothetical protein
MSDQTRAPAEVTEHPDLTIYDPDGQVFYVPFIAADGRVGYRVGRTDDMPDVEHFVYLNPSTGSDQPGKPDVFVYVGIENDPNLDEAVYYVPFDRRAVTRWDS